MAEQEGLETMTVLHKEFPNFAILAISGGSIASAAMLSVARELGATDTLEKPFGKDTLLAEVEKCLRMNSASAKSNFGEDYAGPILPEND